VVLGVFVTSRQSGARLDSDNGPGTDIDMEDDLGLESSMSVARLGGYFWLGRRHRLDFGYFDLSRSATRAIDETIEFGGEIFTINTVVESIADLNVFKADYTFAVVSRDRGFLGINGGLYVASGKISINDAMRRGTGENLTAPLPVVGLRGEYAFTDKITAHGSIQLFGYEADNIAGHFRDFYFGADYAFTPRLALGLAYNDTSMNLGVDKSNGFNGRIDWGYDGVLLYLKFDFGH